MKIDIYSFVFRGFLAESTLDEAGRTYRYANSMIVEKQIAEKLPLLDMDESHVSKAKRMAVVYISICVFENTVRDFIKKVLIEANGSDWWDICVSSQVRDRVRTRIESEEKIQWHAPRGNDPLNYTDFGQLGSIIGKNWFLFEADLNDLEWARHIFTTIEVSRNVCMHSGDLSDRDIERIGSLMKDWLDQVGG